MRRIPFPGNADGVRGNLRSGTEALFARADGRPDLHFPLRRATTPPDPGDLTPSWIRDQLPAVLDLGTRLPAHEAAYFANRLLVHPTGTLYNRPTARTAIPNFFLAGDYVRTDVDLATMEGANESARLAVNALLDADASDAERCEIKELFRPPELEPLKRVDEARYRLGLPNTFDLG